MAVRTIALDYARTGVTINLLAPGPMRAGLFERHLAASADPEEFLSTRTARQPIGRIIGADEVANAAAFLLSDQASGLFATTVTVDVPEPPAVLKMPLSEAVMLPVETTVEFPEEPSL